MSTYPKLVETWDAKHPVDEAYCQGCGATMKWDPEKGDPYDMCFQHECGGVIVMKYDVGQKCKGCDRIDYSQPVDGCCSRRCALQAEYAQSLKGAV